jgi:hypothetical protein
MDFYTMMEMGRIRQAELIREAQNHYRYRLADQEFNAFDRAILWLSEQMIALGRSLRQRYAMRLSNAERA